MRTGTIRYGDEGLIFDVIERPARKTLGIEVYPDGKVLVLAPVGCDDLTIKEKVQLRANWINRQREMFSRYERFVTPRQFLSGETHLYLGRQYRLKLYANDTSVTQESITLNRSEIIICGCGKLPPLTVKELLCQWYLERANIIYDAVLTEMFSPFEILGFKKPNIVIREMKKRWGSLSPKGRMTLNLKLVQAPKSCIEYVVAHELCHLIHRHHNSAFFSMLSRLMTDWQLRKQRLEKALL